MSCVPTKVVSEFTRGPAPNGDFADCGPCTTLECLYLASKGRFKLGTKANQAALITQIRNRGGMDAWGGTQVEDNARAFERYDTEFAARNLTPPKAAVLFNVDFENVFLEHLGRGKSGAAALSYIPIDDYLNPSGQPGFAGPHMVLITDLRTVGGNDWVTMTDPLSDGRRAGVADGPQNIPVAVLKDAMTLYTSAGGDAVRGYTFFCSTNLVDPDPTPTTTTVPGLINKTEDNALAALATAELVAGIRSTGSHATIAAGRVISQNPTAGAVVAQASAVSYTISTGPGGPDPDPDPGLAFIRAGITAGAELEMRLTVNHSDADTVDPNPATPCGGCCDECLEGA